MRTRFDAPIVAIAITLVAVVLAMVPARGEAQTGSGRGQDVLRTPWGDPDLQGVWDFRTITPLERPSEMAGKSVLTAEEAAAFEQQLLDAQDKDRRASDGISAQRDVSNAYNQFWWDYGDSLTDDKRTSLVIDPPDGRVPRKQGGGALRAAFGRAEPAGPEDRPLWERCIIGFNAGPPMLPSAYNNNVQLFQTPGHIAILNEMVHNARLIPLDRDPSPPAEIRQYGGQPRARWEGDTLVVESASFLRETGFTGASSELHLIERFTRVNDDRLLYEFTVEDATAFTAPWTAAIPMKRSDMPLFEYACHEGNYGMTNLLAGARSVEQTANAGSGSTR
jgi:hypothetical protein